MDNEIKELVIGQWRILPDENCFIQDSLKVSVIPKVMDLLLYFAKHPNQVISLQTLSEAVWPNEFVGDNAIYNLIGQLRKALSDNAANPTYIQTLSKKGYRLICDVRAVDELSENTVQKHAHAHSTVANKLKISKYSLFFLGALILVAFLLLWFNSDERNQQAPFPVAQQQLALGEFYLNKGRSEHIVKSIEYFQQSLVLAPDDIPVLLNLGYAYHYLAQREEFALGTYNQKAFKIAAKILNIDNDNADAQVLSQLTDSNKTELYLLESWAKRKDIDSLKHHTIHTISKVLFSKGQMQEAIDLQKRALQKCASCAYIYRSLANSQLVKGEINQAFTNYQIYLELIDNKVTSPISHLGFSHLSKKKLAATANWLAANTLTQTMQADQRNGLALFYLSLRQRSKAEWLMKPAAENRDETFFTLYTLAALSSATNETVKTHRYLERRFTLYPKNPKFALSVAYSYWIAGDNEKALDLLEQHLIKDGAIAPSQTTDIALIQLYGALLIQNKQIEKGTAMLNSLIDRYQQGLLDSSGEGTLGYAQTLALLGEKHKALTELELALESGWVEDFNDNWWYLENDPFFKDLIDTQWFMQLVARHKKAINAISISTPYTHT